MWIILTELFGMSNNIKKNYLFFGFAVPDDEMEKVFCEDKFPAIQTHKFNWNLIKGIEGCKENKYTYISARPISDYPTYLRYVIRGQNWSVNLGSSDVDICEIPFLNGSISKVITRFLSSLFYGFKRYHKVQIKGGVIVYSVHLPFMLAGYVISKFYGIEFIGIWTDPPSVKFSTDSKLKSLLRKFEICISKKIMKKVVKVIVLTKYLAEDFAPDKNYLVIEGIIDEDEVMNENINSCETDEIKIVYTGSLEKRYGIDSLVDGFMKLEDKNVTLEIYGRGNYECEILKSCKKDRRIKYGGFVSNYKILKIQREADFLINTRSTYDEYVKYSFPSKMLEYMMSGTPVITTMLAGIPEEYKQFVIELADNESETIFETLSKTINLTPMERQTIGNNARDFAKSKNYRHQGIKVTDFLSKG